jgi:hypothetical protein
MEKDHPEAADKILETVNAATYGNPEKVLSCTTESLRKTAGQSGKKGIAVSYVTAGKILEANGYSKRGNRKTLQAGEPNPDRNEQFEHINSNARAYRPGRAGYFRGRQEEGKHRQFQELRAGMPPEKRPAKGFRPRFSVGRTGQNSALRSV